MTEHDPAEYVIINGHHRLVDAYDRGIPLPAYRDTGNRGVFPEGYERPPEGPGRTREAYLDPRKVYEDSRFVKHDSTIYSMEGWGNPTEFQKMWDVRTAEEKQRDNSRGGVGWARESRYGPDDPIHEAVKVGYAMEHPASQPYAVSPDNITLSDWKWEGPLPEGTPPLSDIQFGDPYG